MAATVPDEHRRSASIANLLLPNADLPERNLLSLSRLAAEMEPVSPADAAAAAAAAARFSRTRSVPAIDRRGQRASLGVAGPSPKRLSRTKSAFGPGLRRAVAGAVASTTATTATSSASSAQRQPGSAAFDAGVLRPIHPQATSKATSATNSADSAPPKQTHPRHSMHIPPPAGMLQLPRMHPGTRGLTIDAQRRDIFQVAAAHMRGAEYAEQPRTPITPRTPEVRMMDVEVDAREPSSSSHEAGARGQPSRAAGKARTTPDAKRAQNRESAKRFRVAQKKRWADLQETVRERDEEIQRLKDMLQKVTETRLPTDGPRAPAPLPAGPVAADKLIMAELDLFVKLVSSPEQPPASARAGSFLVSPASNIGCLHRVLIAGVDGAIAGVRHQASSRARACGGVGQYVWDDVHESDSLQLRFTVLHASRMAADMAREALVFAYRRRIARAKVEGADAPEAQYMRMKGCVHPVMTPAGEVSHLVIAEFVET